MKEEIFVNAVDNTAMESDEFDFDFSSTKEILPKKHPISLKNKIAVLRNQMAATLASKKTKRHNINKLNINLSAIKNYER